MPQSLQNSHQGTWGLLRPDALGEGGLRVCLSVQPWPVTPSQTKRSKEFPHGLGCYCPALLGLHLGSWNGKPAPIIGTGPSLLPQGHQLLDVLHLQQHLVLEELQVPVAIEGTGSPGCPPSPLGLLVLSWALALCGWQHGGKGRKNGNCPLARSRPLR